MLVSSHDLTLIEDYCDKILFFENGEQKFSDRCRTLKKNIGFQTGENFISGEAGRGDKAATEPVPDCVGRRGGVVPANRNIDMNEIIQILLKEVTIVNIQSEQVSLRDILAQREEQYEEKSDLYENGQTGDPRSLGDHQ